MNRTYLFLRMTSFGEKMFETWCEEKGGQYSVNSHSESTCNFRNGEVTYSNSDSMNNPSEFLFVNIDNGPKAEITDPGVHFESRTGFIKKYNQESLIRVKNGELTYINEEEFDWSE